MIPIGSCSRAGKSRIKGEKMGVLVCYDDFTYDVINDYHLDYLVTTGCIVGYDRSGEWVKNDLLSDPASSPPEKPISPLT